MMIRPPSPSRAGARAALRHIGAVQRLCVTSLLPGNAALTQDPIRAVSTDIVSMPWWTLLRPSWRMSGSPHCDHVIQEGTCSATLCRNRWSGWSRLGESNPGPAHDGRQSSLPPSGPTAGSSPSAVRTRPAMSAQSYPDCHSTRHSLPPSNGLPRGLAWSVWVIYVLIELYVTGCTRLSCYQAHPSGSIGAHPGGTLVDHVPAVRHGCIGMVTTLAQ